MLCPHYVHHSFICTSKLTQSPTSSATHHLFTPWIDPNVAQALGLARPNPPLAVCAKTHRLGSTPFGAHFLATYDAPSSQKWMPNNATKGRLKSENVVGHSMKPKPFSLL